MSKQSDKEIKRLLAQNRRLLFIVKDLQDRNRHERSKVDAIRRAFKILGLKFVSKEEFWK